MLEPRRVNDPLRHGHRRLDQACAHISEAMAAGYGLLERIDEELQRAELVERNETIVLLTKVPLDKGQRTNTMLLHVVGRVHPITLIPKS